MKQSTISVLDKDFCCKRQYTLEFGERYICYGGSHIFRVWNRYICYGKPHILRTWNKLEKRTYFRAWVYNKNVILIFIFISNLLSYTIYIYF